MASSYNIKSRMLVLPITSYRDKLGFCEVIAINILLLELHWILYRTLVQIGLATERHSIATKQDDGGSVIGSILVDQSPVVKIVFKGALSDECYSLKLSDVMMFYLFNSWSVSVCMVNGPAYTFNHFCVFA